MTDEVKVLSDGDLDRIELRQAAIEKTVLPMSAAIAIEKDIPALCATVRALRAENERLSRDSAELARKLENSGRNASLMSQQINAARERSPEYDHRDRS